MTTDGASRPISTADHTHLKSLLDREGWTRKSGRAGLYERWRPSDKLMRRASGPLDRVDVLVPLDPTLSDYSELLSEAIRSFIASSTSLGLSGEKLALDLASAGADDEIDFVKESVSGSTLGRLPWPAGRSLWASAEKTLIAAAKAEVAPVAYYGNLHGQFAQRFLQSCEMGQTRIGSYIVSAHTPVRQLFPVRSASVTGRGAVPQLSGRDITRRLAMSLSAATDAVADAERHAGRPDAFIAGVPNGISKELTEALAGLVVGNSPGHILIEWSTPSDVQGVAHDRTTVGREEFEFKPNQLAILRRATARLKETKPAEQVTVEGWVSVTSRPRPNAPGFVRLRVRRGSAAQALRVELSESQFAEVMDVVKDQQALRVTGIQKIVGRTYSLTQVSSVVARPIEILEETD